MDNKNNTDVLRIGVIVGKWFGGGVEAVLMNYYRNIDKNKIQFDFICDSDSTNIPYEEIEKLGGKVILCPPYQKLFKYIKALKKIFKENKYKIVHSNINALSVFPLYAAKKAGVPVRIAHSHSTSNKKEWKKTLIKNVLRPFSKVYATDFFACSEHAGRWLFGDATFSKGKVTIISNGIDLNLYIYNEKNRNKIRTQLGIKEDDIVVGHVGRFMAQKNHSFILEVFKKLSGSSENYKLMLIGQGPLLNEIKEKVRDLGLEERVYFLGQKEDVYNYYQAMDIFLFPSLYEGLGMVVIEAQTAGLPCIVSSEVPEITHVSDNINYLDLKKPIQAWVENIESTNIKSNRSYDLDRIRSAGFDIKYEAKKLEDIYFTILNDKVR